MSDQGLNYTGGLWARLFINISSLLTAKLETLRYLGLILVDCLGTSMLDISAVLDVVSILLEAGILEINKGSLGDCHDYTYPDSTLKRFGVFEVF